MRPAARPISLDYHQRRCLTFVSATVSLASTVLSTDPGDVLATVDLLLDRGTGRWVLILRDRIIATGPHLPSPSYLAELVADEHDRRRSLDDSPLTVWPEALW